MAASKSRPVRVLAGVAAGATAVTGGLGLVPGVPAWIPAVVGLLGLGLTVGLAKFTEDQVAPYEDVAAMKAPGQTDLFVAGPASPVETGKAVDVTASGPLYPFDPGPVERR